MIKANGIHHIAIATGSMKEQLTFFSDVLGMELVALYWMHGLDGWWHGFMKANDFCYIAFATGPGVGSVPAEIGKTHSGNPAAVCAPGTMQHLAFNVDTTHELIIMRDRLRTNGVEVFGPADHGFCKSIYFAGPENLTLEISTSEGSAINGDLWIDPQVVTLAGINAEELASLRRPKEFLGQRGSVEQPRDATRHFLPPAMNEAWMSFSDQEFNEKIGDPTPPVRNPVNVDVRVIRS